MESDHQCGAVGWSFLSDTLLNTLSFDVTLQMWWRLGKSESWEHMWEMEEKENPGSEGIQKWRCGQKRARGREERGCQTSLRGWVEARWRCRKLRGRSDGLLSRHVLLRVRDTRPSHCEALEEGCAVWTAVCSWPRTSSAVCGDSRGSAGRGWIIDWGWDWEIHTDPTFRSSNRQETVCSVYSSWKTKPTASFCAENGNRENKDGNKIENKIYLKSQTLSSPRGSVSIHSSSCTDKTQWPLLEPSSPEDHPVWRLNGPSMYSKAFN